MDNTINETYSLDEYEEIGIEECAIVLEEEDDKNQFIIDLLRMHFKNQSYEKLCANTSFKILHDILCSIGLCTIVIEENYVDRVYRDSYYFHFSSKHFDYGRYCTRICLFDGELENELFKCESAYLEQRFLGSIVIRPIPDRVIGRTLISPNFLIYGKYSEFKEDEGIPPRIRLANYDLTLYGKRLHVEAFPYCMQDGETTSCAEVTILNMLDYFSKKYSEYHYLLPSSISRIVERNNYERSIPTVGLSYSLISKVFCEVGFYPKVYAAKKMDIKVFKHLLHYYIESGIPVALGLVTNGQTRHSVIGIGYSTQDKNKIGSEVTATLDLDSKTNEMVWTCDTADTYDDYCIMDDNSVPYRFWKCKIEGFRQNLVDKNTKLILGDYEVEYLMVPLYKRMFLEAADANDICLSILASERTSLQAVRKMHEYSDIAFKRLEEKYHDVEKIGTRENPLVTRLFMTSSRSFRKHRDGQLRKMNSEIQNYYNETALPKFIWVCEVSSCAMFKKDKILGEILIDATASADAKLESFILINYPGIICARKPNDFLEGKEPEFNAIETWEELSKYEGNLKTIKNNSDYILKV